MMDEIIFCMFIHFREKSIKNILPDVLIRASDESQLKSNATQ